MEQLIWYILVYIYTGIFMMLGAYVGQIATTGSRAMNINKALIVILTWPLAFIVLTCDKKDK